MSIKNLNIKQINNILPGLSLNNLLNIFICAGVEIEKIKFLPIMMNSVLAPTILKINKNTLEDKIFVEVNVFRVSFFSHLEAKYQQYIAGENSLALETLEYGIKTLFYRYIFRTKSLQKLIVENIYTKKNKLANISDIINHLYKLLSEDYCITINHQESFLNKKLPPPIVGYDDIGNIFLDGTFLAHCYTINIDVFFINKNDTMINKLNNIIRNIERQINNNRITIKLRIIVDGENKNITYIGDYL